MNYFLWRRAVASDPVHIPDPVKFGEVYELDVRAYELRRSGRPLKLERIPMELLVLLVELRGQLVTRDQIIERIWGKGVFFDSDNSINSAVRKIRSVLRDDPDRPRFVVTVTGKGYRFVAPVEGVSPPPPTPSQVYETGEPGTGGLLGKKISHYRIHHMLGGGGMGVVYQAEDLKLGRLVALKFLPSELASDPVAFERMQREARTASSLDHPNICSIYELGEHRGQPFIVMQLLEGQTLREWIEKSTDLSTASRVQHLVDIVVQVLDGLEAAHQKGIIHRDIKPANIFITNRGQAKILDFGVAKFVDAPEPSVALRNAEAVSDSVMPAKYQNLAGTDVLIGTPSYLSPEQIRGELLDARTDLFSLGLTLYEMAAGQKAFSGNTATAIRDAVLNLPVVSVRELNPEVPAELECIIGRALEKDRNLRYQCASEIRADLQRLECRVDPENAPTTKPVSKRTRSWTIAAVVLSIMAAISLGVYNYRLNSVLPPAGRAPLYVAEFTNATSDTVFDDVLRDIVKTELDRSPIVEVADEERTEELLETMGKTYGTRLTPELTQQLCERGHGKMLATGEIKPQGAGYVIELSVLDCASRRTRSYQRVESKNKDEVMATVSKLAATIRVRLSDDSGNPPASPAVLPTMSLPAYKAYLMGARIVHSEPRQSAAMLRRATELDPDFGDAWSWLAIADHHLGETQSETQDLQRAFTLRQKMSDYERTFAEAQYYLVVTGEIYKAIDALRSWEKLEPNEFPPHNLLGLSYEDLGLYQKSTDELRVAATIFPVDELGHENLARAFLAQGRYDEVETTLRSIPNEEPNTPSLHSLRYSLAFLRSDQAALEKERNWMAENADDLIVVSTQARIDLVDGHLVLAHQRTLQAVRVALESGMKESAANAWLVLADAQALLGESMAAHRSCSEAVKLEDSKSVKVAAARVMALNGEGNKAKQIMDKLVGDHPSDTFLNAVDVLVVQAASQLMRGQADQAVRTLDAVKPYEFGRYAGLLPNYLRALAYLRLRKGPEAAAEFQTVLDHRSVAPMETTWEMSQLGLARAYAMQGDEVKARAAYETFLALWKDADPDIPILKQARDEYGKLI